MTYNAKVLMEQGGSVLRVDSGGSISVQAGGALNTGGNIGITSGGSINVQTGGALFLGNVQIMFAASAEGPAGLPVSASPGSIFFRSDGSASNMYVNVSDGTAGSVWKSASIYS